MHHRALVGMVFCVSLLGLAATAEAVPQYAFVDLGTGPAGYNWARLDGGSGGQFIGVGKGPASTGVHRALYWPSSDQQPIDITPAGFTYVYRISFDGGWVAAEAVNGVVSQAILWPAAGGSLINLHPAGGYSSSGAYSIAGNQQVGWASGAATGSRANAMLWSGSAAGVVNLNPAGATESRASGVSGGHQVGSISGARTGGATHATLWSGTPESGVDLNPDWLDVTHGLGLDGSQQVGYGYVNGGPKHAILWSGTAESAVDLNPDGFRDTLSRAVRFGMQAGDGIPLGTSDEYHALLWFGSAGNYLDLHTLLPAGYVSSRAVAIDDSGNILGAASIDGTNFRAVMWVRVPEPCSLLLLVTASVCWRMGRRNAA